MTKPSERMLPSIGSTARAQGSILGHNNVKLFHSEFIPNRFIERWETQTVFRWPYLVCHWVAAPLNMAAGVPHRISMVKRTPGICPTAVSDAW